MTSTELVYPIELREESSVGRMFLAIHYAAPIGFWAHLAFIPLFAWLGVPQMAWLNLASVAIFYLARQANLRGNQSFAFFVIATEVTIHAVLAVMLVGWISGFHYYLVIVVPFLLFNDRHDPRLIIGASTLVTLLYPALWVLAPHNPLGIDDSVLRWLIPMNIVIPVASIGVISTYFRIASMEAERRMQELAMTDPLTRLPNRRRMWTLLREQSTQFETYGRPFTLILADIDRFKMINDTLGHDGGDLVLRQTAERLSAAMRPRDVVARWGGEEFLVLLPDTDLAAAAEVAERFRQAVASAPVEWNGRSMDVTLTLGVASSESWPNVDDCIREADSALYQGKADGRNRVVARQR